MASVDNCVCDCSYASTTSNSVNVTVPTKSAHDHGRYSWSSDPPADATWVLTSSITIFTMQSGRLIESYLFSILVYAFLFK